MSDHNKLKLIKEIRTTIITDMMKVKEKVQEFNEAKRSVF